MSGKVSVNPGAPGLAPVAPASGASHAFGRSESWPRLFVSAILLHTLPMSAQCDYNAIDVRGLS
jgi:hypothetical protein